MEVLGKPFCRFVYPFTFTPASFRGRVEGIGRFPQWKATEIPPDDLLPHVADFLNSDAHATAFAWQLDPNIGVQSFEGLGGRAKWSLTLSGGRELPFCIDGVQLVLFRLGVGFLVWEVRPDASRLAAGTSFLAAWLDLIHFFRCLTGSAAPCLSAQRKIGPDQWIPFFPAMAGLDPADSGERYLKDLLVPLLDCARIEADKDGSPGPWWDEIYARGQMIPYFYLATERAAEGGMEMPELLYRLRNLFHSRQEIHPAACDLAESHPSLLPYAKDQFFVCAMEGGGYVGTDLPDTPFFRQTLRDHVGKQYYLLFLVALNQRFTLMRLHHRVAAEWIEEKDPVREEPQFEGIYEELLEFDAREYFVQVMQKEHHHRCYCKWQDVFEVGRLHAEMSGQLDRMYDYLSARRSRTILGLQELERQRSEATQKMIVYLTFGIGVPALVCSFLGINIADFTSKEGLHWHLAVGVIIASLLVAFGLVRWMIRRNAHAQPGSRDDPGTRPPRGARSQATGGAPPTIRPSS